MSYRRLTLVANKIMHVPVNNVRGVFLYQSGNVTSSSISSGMRLDNLSPSSDQFVRVYKRGVASNCTTVNGGYMSVSAGGRICNATVCSGNLFISDSGLADGVLAYNPTSTTVYSGGLLYNLIFSRTTGNTNVIISSGGLGYNLTQTGSGRCHLTVAGGTAINVKAANLDFKIETNGRMYGADIGDTATGLTGVVASNALIDGITVYSSGTIDIRGGTCVNVTMSGNGTSYKYTELKASGGAICNASGIGRVTVVSTGAYASNVNIPIGSISIYRGSGFNLYTAGKMFCYYNGRISGAVISKGGICSIYSGGVVDDVTISSGGSMIVSSGCSALNVTSMAGAKITSAAGAVVTYK